LIPVEKYNNLWFYEHIYKMVAAFTALLAAAEGTLFPDYTPYSQFLPSVFGTLLAIGFIIYFYKKRKHSKKTMVAFKKILRISGILIITLLLSASIYTCASVPKVSKETNQVIEQVMKQPVPEMVKGEIGFAISNGWNVWYESISPKDSLKGTVILVMGAANDALAWPQQFISGFNDAGYRVVRYDHRGTGLTTQQKGPDRKKDYTLNEMAEDPIAILDTLAIEKAYFVGASMGGMISQVVAIEHPERLAGLTSIMSSANLFDTLLPSPAPEILSKMISAVIKHDIFGGKKSKIKLQVVQKKILMGDATGDIAVKPLAEAALYTIEKRDGYHFIAGRQHQKAIESSESRYKALSKIDMPVLIVHGKQDPVIPIAHGKKMVEIIPNADSLWLDNMGHDLPDALLETICVKVIENFERSQ